MEEYVADARPRVGALQPAVVTLIPYGVARRLHAVAINSTESDVTILMNRPDDAAAVAELQALTGRNVTVIPAPVQEIDALLNRLAGMSDDDFWLQPRHVQAFGRLVDHSINLGERDRVRPLVDRAIEMAPYSAELWLMKARVSEKRPDVIHALELAAQAAPNDARVRRWLQSVRELEDSDEAGTVDTGESQAETALDLQGPERPDTVVALLAPPEGRTPEQAPQEIGTHTTSSPSVHVLPPSQVEVLPEPQLLTEAQRVPAQAADAVLQAVLDLTRAQDLSQLLQVIADRARDLALADSATVFFRTENDWSFWTTDAGLRTGLLDSLPRPNGLAARVLQSLAPLVISDVETRVSEVGELVASANIASFALLPMRGNGHADGLIYLNYREREQAARIYHADPVGRTLELLAACAGVTAKRLLMQRELVDLTAYDPLTRTYNMRQFDQILVAEVERARRHHVPLALLAIDLDDLRQVNHRYGEHVGDAVLRAVAHTIIQVGRTSDVLARRGDDEFTMVLPQTSARAAHAVARRIHSAFREPIELPGDIRLPVSVSIGIATFPEQAGDAHALLNAASIAMYLAKAQGKRGTRAADTMSLGC